MTFDEEFVIPLQRDDLLVTNESRQYVVKEVLTVNEILASIDGCINALSKDGPTFILEHFDLLYSCICHFSRLKRSTITSVWNLMLKAFSSLISDLNLLLDDVDTIEEETRSRNLNVLKMNAYVLCQLTSLMEDEEIKTTNAVVARPGKGRNKPRSQQSEDWTAEKCRVVSTMQELCTLPLHQMWLPPVIEEEFLNLFCNCGFKLLENTGINRMKDLKTSIFHLLGCLLKTYKNTISFGVKVVQVLQQCEHLSAPLAQAMVIFVKDYDVKNLLNQIIREIGRMETKDFSVENQAIRSFSSFLVEIAQQLPSLVLCNIALLATHLDSDPSGMRNCVLSIMGEILLQTHSATVSNGDESVELDEKARKLRDQFLDHLKAHVHDVHAFVRSRALHLWTRLFQEKAVPIACYQSVLEMVVGRLNDKSSSVRKNAMVLLTAILRGNPFAAQLSVDELTKNYNKEKDKLKALLSEDACDEECVENGSDCSSVRRRSRHWADIEPAIKTCLEKIIAGREDISQNSELSAKQVTDIQELIDDDEFEQALSIFIRTLEESSEERIEDSISSNSSTGTVVGAPNNSNASDLLNFLRNLYLGDADTRSRDADEQIAPNNENLPVDFLKQKMVVQYLKDSVNFAKVVNRAVPLVCELLYSSHTTDAQTAIEFFVSAVEFGMMDAMLGIQKMLMLVWSKDASIKEAVVSAYRRLYIIGDGDVTPSAEMVVKNLLNLIKSSSFGQLASLEEMVCQFVRGDNISNRVYECMWYRFANRSYEFTAEDSNAAIVFLGMAAGADVSIIQNNLQLLISVGLGDRAKANFRFARDVCIALLKLAETSKLSVELKDSPLRMPANHIIFERLTEVLVGGIRRLEDDMYVPLVEQSVLVIYKLAEHPDLISEGIIVRIIADIIGSGIAGSGDADLHPSSELLRCPPLILTRLIALCGQLALDQMIHLDESVFTELKRRHFIANEREKKNKEKKKDGKKRRASKRQSLSANAALTPRDKNNSSQLDLADDDCSLNGAIADDADAEYIRKVCESELVCGENMLACFAPLVVVIVSNPGQFPDHKLQASACLALTKYMMVSSEFCDDKMQLLITILEKSTQATIRANTIVALGDLACRFPNIVEPWTAHLYARLSDQSFQVRRNALVVLTHLILHDMIKVKGQISDLALCVIDDDVHIADLAKVFFQELSQKANAVYNVLPDIITRLSDLTIGTTETNFQAVMKYILQFIQKEKLLESLVEKLLHRFTLTRSERQWRDLAFCMPLLCHNVKSYLMIVENLSCIADKLHEETVYKHFTEVVAFAKKNTPAESQAVIDELEQKIEECHTKAFDEEAVVTQVSQKFGHVKIRATKGKKSRTSERLSRGREPRVVSIGDDDEEGDEFQGRRRQNQRVREKTRRKRITLVLSSDSDGDMAPPTRKSPNGVPLNNDEENSDSDY